MHHPQAVTDIFEEIRVLVSGMLDTVRAKQHPESRLARAQTLLQSLPLTTSDYLVHKRRLRTVSEYCRSAEFGAAAFELRIIYKSMEKSASAQIEFEQKFFADVIAFEPYDHVQV